MANDEERIPGTLLLATVQNNERSVESEKRGAALKCDERAHASATPQLKDGHLKSARKALVAVRARELEFHAVFHRLGSPHSCVIAFRATVERVGAVVGGEWISLVVHRKSSALHSVRDPAHDLKTRTCEEEVFDYERIKSVKFDCRYLFFSRAHWSCLPRRGRGHCVCSRRRNRILGLCLLLRHPNQASESPHKQQMKIES